MGAAAYNRGTRAIRASIDREQPDHETRCFRDLSALSARVGHQRMFAGSVIRWNNGQPWLMNRADRGWAEFGLPGCRLALRRQGVMVAGGC